MSQSGEIANTGQEPHFECIITRNAALINELNGLNNMLYEICEKLGVNEVGSNNASADKASESEKTTTIGRMEANGKRFDVQLNELRERVEWLKKAI